MRIAIVANTSWYVFNFRKNLIRSLQDDGHEVCVIAPPDDYVNKLVQLGVKCFSIGLSQRGVNPFREIISCLKLFSLFRAIQPDVVLTFTVKCNLYTGICRRFSIFEQIANISGLGEAFEKKGLLNFIVSCLYKWALAKSRRVFFQNNEDLQAIVQRHLLSVYLCIRIPGSGVNLDTFYPAPFLPKNNPRKFLMFGRLVPKKGYDLFMKVAEEIHIKHKHRAEFWIMGIEDKSRKESRRLLEQILRLQDKGIVKYLAPRDDVVPVLHSVDIVVLPSEYHEGVPRTLLEAMACGKPIITTDWKGCKDTVDHGVNGYLISVSDGEVFKRCILKFIAVPSTQIEKMGMASRKKAENEFDERKVLTAYLNEIANIEPRPRVEIQSKVKGAHQIVPGGAETTGTR